jgi:hypothetical protein
MAGKNQHYIPQFLQRGFSCQAAQGFAPKSKKDNENAQIWLFKRESAKIAHIRKEGAEKYFYGAKDSDVDKVITDAEYSYGKLVNALRRHNGDTPVRENDIPELLAHMITRTKHIRQIMSDLGDSALDVLRSSLPNAEELVIFLISYLQNNPDKIGAGLAVEQQQILVKLIQDNPGLILDLIGNQYGEDIYRLFNHTLLELKEDVDILVKDAHLNTLIESIEPQLRVDRLRCLHWFISVKKPGSYILSDSLVIFQHNDGSYSSVWAINEEIQCVFLPISSQRLLIGTKETEIPRVNPEDINYASSRLSSDFFIASQNTEREVAYQQDLGKSCSAFLDEKYIEMVTIANQHWQLN